MASIIRLMKQSRRNSMMFLINNIARGIADDNDGKIPDVFLMEARLKDRILKDPGLLDYDGIVKDCRKHWEKLNHEVLIPDGLTGVRFIPGAFLTIGKRQRVIMKKAKVADVIAWQQVDDVARDNFTRTLDKRDDYRKVKLREFAGNGDCTYLGEIEAKLHGYVEQPGDEAAHLDEAEGFGVDDVRQPEDYHHRT